MPVFWGKIDKGLLKPDFLADVDPFLANSPYNWYVTEGYRSPERSAKLYDEYINGVWTKDPATGLMVRGKRGPRAAPAGRSAHNFGLAIDVALDGDPIKPGLQMLWDVTKLGWLWLKINCFKHPRLKNGNSFGDWPHIERYKWEAHK